MKALISRLFILALMAPLSGKSTEPPYKVHSGRSIEDAISLDGMFYGESIAAERDWILNGDFLNISPMLRDFRRLPGGPLFGPAIGKAMTIGFDEFSGQVRAYLLPEYFDHYDRRVWEELQTEVVEKLEGLA